MQTDTTRERAQENSQKSASPTELLTDTPTLGRRQSCCGCVLSSTVCVHAPTRKLKWRASERHSVESDEKTVCCQWGGAAETHLGFQNSPGFEMLEMQDSGPFLKLGGGGEHRPTWIYQNRRKVQDRSGSVSGEGDPEGATKLAAVTLKRGGLCLLDRGQRKGLQWLLTLTGKMGGKGSLHAPSRLKLRSHHTPYQPTEQGDHPFLAEECLGSAPLPHKDPHTQGRLRKQLPRSLHEKLPQFPTSTPPHPGSHLSLVARMSSLPLPQPPGKVDGGREEGGEVRQGWGWGFGGLALAPGRKFQAATPGCLQGHPSK